MSESQTLARPYAEAVLDLAKSANSFDEWSKDLEFLSKVAQDKSIVELVSNPSLGKTTLSDILLDICGDKISQEGKNLLRLLIDNQRLMVLPELAVQYEKLRAQHQQYVNVEITSAFFVVEEQKQEIESTLKQRLGKAVNITTRVDTDLIGGWVIRAGDEVIDISLQGRLAQLAAELNSI